MVKKLSILALAGTLALPAAALAGGGAADMQNQIDTLTKQLEQLKSQLEKLKVPAPVAAPAAPSADISALKQKVDALEERSSDWDMASRIQLSGDFRVRGDYMTAETPTHYGASQITDALANGAALREYAALQSTVAQMKGMTAAARKATFAGAPYNTSPVVAKDYDNDTVWTNRFRLNMRAKATENMEFKGRLAMYKVWGMQNNVTDYTYNAGTGGGPYMLSGSMSGFDGASTRNAKDNVLRVDRAFMNWNNIGGTPVWFSLGRRPTTDGPPSQLRQNGDDRLATASAYMDWPFDGMSLGYAYNNLFGINDAPGRIRLCYGRGFESGPTDQSSGGLADDTDFGGVSWDVYQKENRFIYVQSFGAFNIFNVPDNVNFTNPFEYSVWRAGGAAYNDPHNSEHNLILDRDNLGNIYHSAAVYMDKVQAFNYFVHGGWSRTDPQGTDELGNGLLSGWWDEPTQKNGYSVHLGGRYDLDDYGLKFGAEYNYGSKNWLAMAPGHDDFYQSKLATRGHVYEVYGIYDLPTGEAISKFGKAFMRLGYQHYEYNYTGSGFWLGEPYDIDDLAADPFMAQFYVPVESQDQVYVTMEMNF